MRRFIITASAFTGSIELVYNTAGVLGRMDALYSNMDAEQIKKFKAFIPAQLDNLQTAFKGFDCQIVEEGITYTFEEFWDDYGHKRNKEDAKRLWEKMTLLECLEAKYSIPPYNRYCARNSWYNRLYPDTYLRKKHFKTEWDKVK